MEQRVDTILRAVLMDASIRCKTTPPMSDSSTTVDLKLLPYLAEAF